MTFDFNKARDVFPVDKYSVVKNIFSRKDLSVESRLLCAIAGLQASANTGLLRAVLDLYINDGEQLRKAYETLLQGYLFCGYPRAIESFFCLDEVLQKRRELSVRRFEPVRLKDDTVLMAKGETTARLVHKDKFDKIRNKISDFCPDLGYLMIAEGYGHVLSRDGLSIKLRELAVVSSLTTLGADRQLYSHIRGARNVGCGDNEIYEAIVTGFIWAPLSQIENGIELWSEITRKTPTESFSDLP